MPLPQNDTSSTHETTEQRRKKRKVPLIIMILVGIFFIAMLSFMVADYNSKSSEQPSSEAPAQKVQPN